VTEGKLSTGDHAHAHAHAPAAAGPARLAWTLGLVVAFAVAEVAGGLVSGSLALLADAGHMASDAAALGLTLFAMHIAQRAPSPTRTFGYQRAEILAALANGATLVAIAVLIVVEAIGRLRTPVAVESGVMLGVAVAGLAVNVVSLVILRSGRRGTSLNLRGAWLHVFTDALGSVQAIGAAVAIALFGWTWIDPVASILIALLVVYASWSLLRESIAVLMEGVPGDIDLDHVRAALSGVVRVRDVHDLHVWSITSGFVALSAHLVIDDEADAAPTLRAAQGLLAERFGIRHTTLQLDIGAGCRHVDHA
jgi:cobalt-zinc-cadmium efflux system protein